MLAQGSPLPSLAIRVGAGRPRHLAAAARPRISSTQTRHCTGSRATRACSLRCSAGSPRRRARGRDAAEFLRALAHPHLLRRRARARGAPGSSRSSGPPGRLIPPSTTTCWAPHAALDIWETEYLQVLEGDNPVKEWTKGTWLRPLLDALAEPERRRLRGRLRRRWWPAPPAASRRARCFPSGALHRGSRRGEAGHGQSRSTITLTSRSATARIPNSRS